MKLTIHDINLDEEEVAEIIYDEIRNQIEKKIKDLVSEIFRDNNGKIRDVISRASLRDWIETARLLGLNKSDAKIDLKEEPNARTNG